MHMWTRQARFALAVIVATACGGDVIGVSGLDDGFDDGGLPPDDREPDIDRTPSTGGSTGGGTVRPPPPPPAGSTCGNGRLERSEQCDGSLLNAETCATATMNAAPNGTLRCGSTCVLDTSGCTFRDGPSQGGAWGGGGAVGRGGTWGGRRPPPARRPLPPTGGTLGYPPPYPWYGPYPGGPSYPSYPSYPAGGAAPYPPYPSSGGYPPYR